MNIRKIVKKVIPTQLFKAIEPTGHLFEAVVMNVRYGFPGRKVRVIGVTGTNGKTTTTVLIQRMLHEAGVKAALMSTVAHGVGDELIYPKLHMTTNKASVLQSRLREYGRKGVEWVVIETSSHALAQHRVWGVPYEVAVLTNLTHDHLDYHGTFENYREAKRQLFILANKRGLRAGIVNDDDANAEVFASSVKNATTYGIENGDVKAIDIASDEKGSTFTAVIGEESFPVAVNIPGDFNISNSLAAISVGKLLGLSNEAIQKGIAATTSVEGRMHSVSAGQPFKVMIDFASTPDGFERFFAAVRPLVKGKLVAVFGSAGERDPTKRGVQGEIAARYADELILTEEDDRNEDGEIILEAIAVGARAEGKQDDQTIFKRLDRESAIGFALTRVSSPEDMVVFLGKGHEKTIERADGEYPWNETEVVTAALEMMLQEKAESTQA